MRLLIVYILVLSSLSANLNEIEVSTQDAENNFIQGYSYISKTKKLDIYSQEFKHALLSLEKATQLEPSNVRYIQAYAVMLLQLKDVREAQIMATEILYIANIISPDDVKIKLLLVQASFNKQEYYLAIEQIKNIVNQDQNQFNEPSLINIFLLSSVFIGSIDESSGYLQSIVNRFPQNYGAMIGLLTLYNISSQEYETKYIKEKKVYLKQELKSVYEKYFARLSPDIKTYIKNLLNGEV